MMEASHGIARCSSHDLSILVTHLLRSLRAQCIFLEPVLSLNTLLRGPADRLTVWPKTHSPQVMSRTSLIPPLVLTSAVNTRRSTLLYDERMSTSRMIFFLLAVPEDFDVLHRQTVGSQRCAASTMLALRNLDSSSSTEKSVRGYETIVQSFSSIGKTMQGNRAFTSTSKPVRGDESVASLETNVSRTQVDRDHDSGNRFGLREHLERKAEIAIQGGK